MKNVTKLITVGDGQKLSYIPLLVCSCHSEWSHTHVKIGSTNWMQVIINSKIKQRENMNLGERQGRYTEGVGGRWWSMDKINLCARNFQIIKILVKIYLIRLNIYWFCYIIVNCWYIFKLSDLEEFWLLNPKVFT